MGSRSWLIFDGETPFRQGLAEIIAAGGEEVNHFSSLGEASEILNYLGDLPLFVLMGSNLGSEQVPLIMRQILGQYPGAKGIFCWEPGMDKEKFQLTPKEFRQLGIYFFIEKRKPTEALVRQLLELEFTPLNSGPIEGDFKTSEAESGTFVNDDREYFDLPIKHVLAGVPIPFDLYIRIRLNRYVKILNAHDCLSQDRLKSFISKGMDKVFIKKNERMQFLKMANSLHLDILKRKDITIERRVSASVSVVEQIFLGIRDSGLDPIVLDHSFQVLDAMYSKVKEGSEIFEPLEKMIGEIPDFYFHNYLVSLFSLMILDKFSGITQAMRDELALAGLLHDVGKENFPPFLRAQKKSSLNPSQLKIYKRHPQLGAEALATGDLITPNVLMAIEQHHEKIDGSGFPRGISGSSIHRFGRILSLSDDLVHYLTEKKEINLAQIRKFLLDPTLTGGHCKECLANLDALISHRS